MHTIKIWNWTESNPEIKILNVTTEELQKWKQISDYDESYGTHTTTDKTWYEEKITL